MSESVEKVEKIVDAVYVKTISGAIRWDKAFIHNSYALRFGDYVIQLDGGLEAIGEGHKFSIKKLSGSVVAIASNKANALISHQYKVSEESYEQISDMIKLLGGNNDDLDEVLKLIS